MPLTDLGLSADKTKALLDQIPVAYAGCYIWGTLGTGMIVAYLGPILIGVNIEDACKDYAAKMGAKPDEDFQSAWHQLEIRAYQIEATGHVAGKTVAEAEMLHPTGERIFVERIQRGRSVYRC